MDIINQEIEIRIQQIKDFAKGNMISYNTILDILEDKTPPLEEKQINQIIEELVADGINIVSSDEPSDMIDGNDDPESFIPANVQISQRTMTIWNLMERLNYNEFDLQPGFQRQGDLWTLEQQSRLIESLMLKIPLPAFYFDASQDEKWKVIDGLQRLSAIRRFLVGMRSSNQDETENFKEVRQEPFCGLQYLKDFNNLTFDQLPRQYIRRIKEAQIIAYTVEKGTPDAVVFNIFQRINTGGLNLEPQEIRHALYQGKATKLTEELAQSDEFINATKGAVSPERMQDLEFVNRFIAFTELDYKKVYRDDINSFLNKSLKTVNTYSEEELDRVRNNFKRSMNWSAALFGKYAFRKYSASWRRSQINKSMFELWAICFHEMSEEEADLLIANRDKFLEAFRDLQQTVEFKSSFDSTKTPALNKRVQLTKKFLEEFLCCNQ